MLEDSRWQRGQLSKQGVKSKLSLALIILAVSDLQRSLGFYRRVFDWQEAVNTPGYVEFQLPNDLRLGLYLREGFARNVGQMPLLVSEAGLTSTEVFSNGRSCWINRASGRSRRSQTESTGASRLGR